LFDQTLVDHEGGASLTTALSAVGSANELRLTITNNDADFAFSGKVIVTFWGFSKVAVAS